MMYGNEQRCICECSPNLRRELDEGRAEGYIAGRASSRSGTVDGSRTERRSATVHKDNDLQPRSQLGVAGRVDFGRPGAKLGPYHTFENVMSIEDNDLTLFLWAESAHKVATAWPLGGHKCGCMSRSRST